MEFLPEEIEAYIKAHTVPESKLLHQLNRETYQKVLVPRMLSGHLQGRVLSMLSHMIKPKCILEIGTYKEALEIIKKDPMIKNNIVEWKLNEWININQ